MEKEQGVKLHLKSILQSFKSNSIFHKGQGQVHKFWNTSRACPFRGWPERREMDVPERSMEKLFALASSSEGVGKNGDVRHFSNGEVFFDFRMNMDYCCCLCKLCEGENMLLLC